MTLLQCREPAFRAGRRALDTAPARWLRGVCSDPEGSRLASGSALPDAIDGIGPGI
ncbi:hypothetical protein [Paraburkholderia ferrariae]|uniref:hypothetical protein n=1 Tax=Paraburkholderia ferrariae TaxID=386056 RepID=UPI0012EBD15A|nr:hypothetical protein [Paraburkholderia ferrariae]